MTDRDLTELVARTLHEQAGSATVTPAAAAERAFWAGRPPRQVPARRAAVAVGVAVLVAVLLLGLVLRPGGDVGARDPVAPAVPTRPVTPTTVLSSVADATAHLIGNGAVVGDRLWFVLDNRLVVTGDDGRRVTAGELPDGTDGEALCCVRDAGRFVVVPTGDGYSFRDASTGAEVVAAGSDAPGPAAVVREGVWLRAGIDELALVSPATGERLRTLRVSGLVDVLAADEQRLYVASQAASTVVGIDPGSGAVEWSRRLGSPPRDLAVTDGLVFSADAEGGLTVIGARSGAVRQRWRAPIAAQGPRPRLAVARGAVWWSPDAGTVVRLGASDGVVTGAVGVGVDRRWDNADQQRNGLYVTAAGIWLPTRNDADDYQFHRLPLSLLEP